MNLDYNFVDFGIIFSELQSFKVEPSKLKYFSFLDIILDYNSEFYISLTDKSYERDFSRVPENYDFEVVTEMAKFFEKFKTKTKLVSATSKPLINLFIREVIDVDIHLRNWSTKPMFLKMVKDMKTKYDKYWDIKARQMVREIENMMENLFMTYLKRFDNGGSSQQEASQKVIDVDDNNDFFGDFLCTGGSNSDPTDNEFRTYLKENITYWRYKSQVWRPSPRLAHVVEFLLTLIVEALLCTQDWLRKSTNPIIDNVDDILNDDDIALEIAQALNMLDMDDNDMGKRPIQD
uniref:hAT-like transposase RNase-H fold domain-containing protein n=1 Tax=Lactuca sativa TaxID=4236 RepID=A0A9R1XFU9_LACSA|nr:hypothetical protein LSAT_V11C400206790 [Lactuca sativa]